MISIGIPFFNSEKTLEKAIRSVFAQTFQDWELLLVDDGSTDRSLEIARSVKDPRVRIISDGRNRHLAARLNQIATEAKYDLVARMDSDDIMFPRRLETQIRLFDDPEIQVASCYYLAIDNDDNVLDVWPYAVEEFTPKLILTRQMPSLCHPAMMARKEWFLQNPYDESLPIAQDIELWVRTSSSGRLPQTSLRIQPEPILFYRAPDTALGDCSKHLKAEKIGRFFYWKYGPEILGWPGTFYWLLRDWAKTRVLAAATHRKMTGYYIKYISRFSRRRNELDEKVRIEYQNELNKALSVRIPGLDDGGTQFVQSGIVE